MAFFNEFPRTRTYNSDLGWLIWAMKKLIADWENFSNTNSIRFADPLNWSIANNYEPSTIVVDDDGNGYISRKAVPAGIPLSNNEYWTEIFSFGDITNTIRENIAANADSSPTAPFALIKGQLVWWNDDLYQALYDIAAGTAFIENTNVQRMTVDEKIKELAGSITSVSETLTESINAVADDLTAETEAREAIETKTNGYPITPQMFGAVGDGVHDDGEAINAALAEAYYGKSVYFPSGTYLTSQTLNYHHLFNNVIDASDAIINYTGNEYAIDINYVDWCDLKFGYIFAHNGGGIKIWSNASNNHVQYDNIYFHKIEALTNCIFINPSGENGWCNELRFHNGTFAAGAVGCLVKNENTNYTCNHLSFYAVGVEGVTLGFRFDATTHIIAEILCVGLRTQDGEIGTGGVYEILGNVYSLKHIAAHEFRHDWISISGNLYRSQINTTYLDAAGHRHKGAFIEATVITPYDGEYMPFTAINQVQAGDDMNTYTKAGVWFLSYASMTGTSNLPDGIVPAKLTVSSNDRGTYVIQTFEAYNEPKTWKRYSNADASSWGDWFMVNDLTNYTDVDVAASIGANGTGSYTFPNNRTAYAVQLLYTYHVYQYKANIALSPDGRGVTFVTSATSATNMDFKIRIWYK